MKQRMSSIQTIDTLLTHISFGAYQKRLLALCALGYFAVCAELLVLVFVAQGVQDEFNISRTTFSWLPFAGTVSNFAGGLLFGVAGDVYGRQGPFIISVLLTGISGLTSAFAPSFITLVFLRSVMSFGLGGITAIDFVLFLETTPSQERGRFNVGITAGGSLGVIGVAALAWYIQGDWRTLMAIVALPSFLVAGVRLKVTEESPRYLLSQGRIQEAAEIIKRIAQVNGMPHLIIELDTLYYDPVLCMMTEEKEVKALSFRETLRNSPKLRNTTIALSFVWLFQFWGYWGMTIYLPTYLTRIGVNFYQSFMVMVSMQLPALALLSYFIDRVGRLTCLRICAFASAIIVAIFAVLDTSSWIFTVLAMFLYAAICPIFAILFTYSPELYSTQLRSTAMGLLNAVSCIPGLTAPFISSWLLTLPQQTWLYPIVWASCFALVFLFSFALHTETSTKTLDS